MTQLDASDDTRPASRSWRRWLIALFMVACTAFWIFAFSPIARDIFTAPDQLEDEQYVEALDQRCAAARSSLLELPAASTASTPVERAETLVRANSVLGAMVADLADVPGGTDGDRRLVDLWLGDWEIYLRDRDAHADRLGTEGDVRFLNTVDEGIYVHERMDGFARVNDLVSCETPGDV